MTRDEANVITQLVQTVSGLVGRFDAQEQARAEAREQDNHWRDRMEQKVDRMAESLNEMPCVMDEKIAACREDRETVTRDAVADASRRHVLASVATDWRTWVAFAVAVVGFGIGVLR